MNKKNRTVDFVIIIILAIIFLPKILAPLDSKTDDGGEKKYKNDNVFRIIASTSTKKMDDKLIKYGKKNGIILEIILVLLFYMENSYYSMD